MRTCDGALKAAAARIREDVATVRAKDPAACSRREVLLYPHIHALWTYRVAHRLWHRGHRLTARALSLGARAVSGIEIHPAAVIGRRFFVDHGTAVVIGATVRIGDDVMLYHQVTLGSVGWWKDLRRPAGARRHPVVEDGVIIGTGASVLGPVTIGAGARIGAHTVVLTDVEPGSRVSAPAAEIHSPAGDQTPDRVPRPAPPSAAAAETPAAVPVPEEPAALPVPEAPAAVPVPKEPAAQVTPVRIRPVQVQRAWAAAVVRPVQRGVAAEATPAAPATPLLGSRQSAPDHLPHRGPLQP
ncbi:serine O-acetyltransferase EpsC [Streptomyces montanisoli]|uniref:serine O-acetyltransferase EpsC n=1 Tax=Streptomyces montanisoli TaxID=2798581 RepID=UPI001FD7FE25|nr:serine O-acetyltransferase EpsC [Streptomyces montanisoli]